MAEKRVALQRSIQAWTVAQSVHMPLVVTARAVGSFTPLSIPVDGPLATLETSEHLSFTGPSHSLAHPSLMVSPSRPMSTSSEQASGAVVGDSRIALDPGREPEASIRAPNTTMNGSTGTDTTPQTSAVRKRKRRGGQSKRAAKKPKATGSTSSKSQTTNNVGDFEHAEHIALWLPSQIPVEHRSLVCSEHQIALEIRFRLAEVEDALVAVKKALRMHALVRSQFKGAYGTAGNKRVTRGHDSITSRATHCLLLTLTGPGGRAFKSSNEQICEVHMRQITMKILQLSVLSDTGSAMGDTHYRVGSGVQTRVHPTLTPTNRRSRSLSNGVSSWPTLNDGTRSLS
jgi:hypothetical protein